MADETPEERRALADLDAETRQVAADGLDAVVPRGTGFWGLFTRFGRRREAPPGSPGLREALHDGEPKE
jgi:hypothetical protein